jgi:hypothetical protein
VVPLGHPTLDKPCRLENVEVMGEEVARQAHCVAKLCDGPIPRTEKVHYLKTPLIPEGSMTKSTTRSIH